MLLDVHLPVKHRSILEDSTYVQEPIELQSGDAFVIYSDGVLEAGIKQEIIDPDEDNPEEDAFGQERLEAVILENASLSAEALLDAISNAVTRHASGNKQYDDITLIVMKVE